jgi:hypothetical protein
VRRCSVEQGIDDHATQQPGIAHAPIQRVVVLVYEIVVSRRVRLRVRRRGQTIELLLVLDDLHPEPDLAGRDAERFRP